MVIVKPMSSLVLPKLEGEIMLDVFTHKSIRPATSRSSSAVEHDDNDRLAVLGQVVLEMATTHVLFNQRPCNSAEQIRELRVVTLSDSNIKQWVQANGLLGRLRYIPELEGKIETPEELRFLFNSYIGALFLQKGIAPIQEWMAAILDPNGESLRPPSPATFPLAEPPAYQSSGNPQPPAGPPPPIPAPPPPDGVNANGHMVNPNNNNSMINLALVNQTASQKGCQIQYNPESTGPPHQPTWMVRCMINGVEKGKGAGRNQKIAKEEAAKRAYVAMGWGP